MFFDEGLTAPADHGYCFGPVVIKPTSRGRVTLRTPLPDSKPRVLCNFLTTPEDRESVLIGMKIALEIARQEPLRAVERAADLVKAVGRSQRTRSASDRLSAHLLDQVTVGRSRDQMA